jgi:CheY-like chemotaxis protein
MITKEQVLAISDLKLAGKPAVASQGQFELFAKTLNSFIDTFPSTAEKMQNAVDRQAYGDLSRGVADTFALLSKIYADDIVKEYRKKFDTLNKADEKDYEALEAFVENFVLAVNSLSVDIQMALKRPAGVAVRHSAPPVSRPAPQSSPSPATQVRGGSTWGGQPRILAVDNAVMFLNTMKRLLEGHHYELHCVTSGEEALQFIQNNRPDVFLLDIEMPGIDGYELARRIRSQGHNAPIIFITANSAREYVDKAAEAGGVAMLMKPLRINQLLGKLKEHI